MEKPPLSLGNVLTCGSENHQGHEQAHNGEYSRQGTTVAVLAVGERRSEHIQGEWRRQLSRSTTRQSQDAVEHLERAVNAEDQRREQDGRQQGQDDVAYEPQPRSTINACALENVRGNVH